MFETSGTGCRGEGEADRDVLKVVEAQYRGESSFLQQRAADALQDVVGVQPGADACGEHQVQVVAPDSPEAKRLFRVPRLMASQRLNGHGWDGHRSVRSSCLRVTEHEPALALVKASPDVDETWSRSTLPQVRPSSSPERAPVVTASTNGASSRCPRAACRKRRTCSGLSITFSRLTGVGGSTSSDTLRDTRPQRTAFLSML